MGMTMAEKVLAPFQTINMSWEERRSSILHTRPGIVGHLFDIVPALIEEARA
jgi:hypothetical protein